MSRDSDFMDSNDDSSESLARVRKPLERPAADPIDTDSSDVVVVTAKPGKAKPLPKKAAAVPLAKPAVVAETVKRIETEKATKKTKKAKEPKAPRESVHDWPGMAELASGSGVRSVTCVDPGTSNLAIIRFEFVPEFRMTHAKVVNLGVVAAEIEEADEQFRIRSNRGSDAMEQAADYAMKAKLGALRSFVAREARPGGGGVFDSDFLIVEEQSFDRLMTRVESTIVSVYETVHGAQFCVLPGSVGGSIAAAQVITKNSVNSYYRPLFPLLSKAQEAIAAGRSKGRPRPFGMGDNHSGESNAQRLENKRNAIKYGSMLIPQERFEALVPAANFTDYDRERLRERKMDDLYDTMFMAMYFCSSFMFEIRKIKRRGISRALPAYETLPPRSESKYEELTELAAVAGADAADLQTLYYALYGDDAPRVD